MKLCPKCNETYSDDTLRFCLQDGTPLVGNTGTGPASGFGEIETVVGRKGADIHGSYGPESGWGRQESNWGQSQVTRVAGMDERQPPVAKSGFRTVLAVLITAFVMIVFFGIAGLGAYLWLRPSSGDIGKNKLPNQNIIGSPTPYPTFSSSPSATPTRSLTPAPTATPYPSPTSTIPPPPSPPALKSYPSTSRLTFARGAFSTSFSGDLNPNGSRSLVLYCLSGQTLSATVSSGGGCVSVGGGGTSIRSTTSRGDNYIALNNKCSSVVHFTVTVSVF